MLRHDAEGTGGSTASCAARGHDGKPMSVRGERTLARSVLATGLAGSGRRRALRRHCRAGLVALVAAWAPSSLAGQQEGARGDDAEAAVRAKPLIGAYYGTGDFRGNFAAVQLLYPVRGQWYVFALGARRFGTEGSGWSGEMGLGAVSSGFFSLHHHVQIGLGVYHLSEGGESRTLVRGVVQVGFELPKGRIRPFVAGRGLLWEKNGAELIAGVNVILQ